MKSSNRVALVCGSSRGIGKGCAIKLAESGYDLVICARGENDLNETKDIIKEKTAAEVLSVACDLSRKEQVEHLVEAASDHFGRIDALIVNSGGPPPKDFFKIEEKEFLDAFHSVLYYAIYLYQSVIPFMIEHNWGRIVNISSLTVKEPNEELLLSGMYRAALVNLSKSLSKKLIQHNITVNNVIPGAVKTSRADELIQMRSEREKRTKTEIESEMLENFPPGRYQTINEIGSLVDYLCSEDAATITGATVNIDGGFSKSMF